MRLSNEESCITSRIADNGRAAIALDESGKLIDDTFGAEGRFNFPYSIEHLGFSFSMRDGQCQSELPPEGSTKHV